MSLAYIHLFLFVWQFLHCMDKTSSSKCLSFDILLFDSQGQEIFSSPKCPDLLWGGAEPASYLVGGGVLSPGVKWPMCS